jgi:hypothetical protein
LERLSDVLVLDFDLVATKAGYRPKEVGPGDLTEAEAVLLPLIRKIKWTPDRLRVARRDLQWFIDEDEEKAQ